MALDLNKIITSAGGQRWVMTMGAAIVHTALFVAKLLPVEAYVTLTLGTVGAFILSATSTEVARVLKQGTEFERDPFV